MKDLIIIGAGGFAREVAWLVEEINEHNPTWTLLGFYDEYNTSSNFLNGYKLITEEEFNNNKEAFLVIAVGDSEVRKEISNRYSGRKFAILIHPHISISTSNKIDEGTIICKGSILTVNITIGKHTIINLDCTVGHDVILEDYSTVLPGVNVSGHVNVGECTSIGTGSKIIQNVSIGHNSIIGAGSIVVKNIDDYVVAVGIPAKAIKKRGVL